MNLVRIIVILLSLVSASCATRSEAPERRPNIVLIYVDDMGYADLSVTGNRQVQTENIDRLAREGLRFTNFRVAAPICSPSRVGVTTGTFPARWRLNSYLDSRERNRARAMADYLDPRAPTLARALQRAGYATGHFGKWHMGGGRDVGDAPLSSEYGFDESVTSFEGLGTRYLWPDRLNEQSAKLGRGEITWTEKRLMTKHYVDHAIDFINRHQEQPFYINVWPEDVHDAWLPHADHVEPFRTVTHDEDEQKYFAVLDEMDRQLGRLFNEIDRLGLAEETIILFTSDNGPTDAPWYYDDGNLPPGRTAGLRGRKLSLYEGGIREPLIVRWPGHAPAGVVDSTTVITAVDLAPSLAQLADAEIVSEFALDGEDLSPA
ncbi:MAG: sulfatase-like hydrolase/transferase, partial [Gemmatimonadota bacterium]